MRYRYVSSDFFFQAEDGIRDLYVTGVQKCALPIWETAPNLKPFGFEADQMSEDQVVVDLAYGSTETELLRAAKERGAKIGRASCRERVYNYEGVGCCQQQKCRCNLDIDKGHSTKIQ